MSVLMALILLMQLYFMHATQEELLAKINRISNSINEATDTYYAEVLNYIKEQEKQIWHEQNLREEHKVIRYPDSLYLDVVSELRNVRQWKSDWNFKEFFPDSLFKFDKEKFFLKWSEKERMDLQKQMEKMKEAQEILKERYQHKVVLPDNQARQNEIMMLQVMEDSMKVNIQTIDIDLNFTSDEQKPTIVHIPKRDLPLPSPKSKVFSFRVPDFSLPHAPKMIRYHYDLDEIERAFKSARNRNMLISLGLFMVSIIAITFISRRILKPVANLKTSFDQVVEGNLDVSIAAQTRDEIGDLTQAFNGMVMELKKNREKERMLQQKERLASMGQLAAGVAHEIKNPLNAINLTIQHLRDKYAVNDQNAQKYIETVQNEIHRLDKIVNNFLNFIRSEQLQKKETDLNGLIQEVLQLYSREIASQNITLDTRLGKKFIRKVDPERFKTVLMNVILNAIQAMSDGGKLVIRTDVKKKLISVEDSGCGILSEHLEKIFDLFYTTKSQGTGLGLPTSYKIIKEHGGDMSIKSEMNKGTIVQISL
jgi:signal transduction histidine kinase